MADALQNYIDGKWVDALDGGRFDVFDPSTGAVIATAPDSQPDDVERAVAAATTARGGLARRHVSVAGSCCEPPTSCVANANGSPRWSP